MCVESETLINFWSKGAHVSSFFVDGNTTLKNASNICKKWTLVNFKNHSEILELNNSNGTNL